MGDSFDAFIFELARVFIVSQYLIANLHLFDRNRPTIGLNQ